MVQIKVRSRVGPQPPANCGTACWSELEREGFRSSDENFIYYVLKYVKDKYVRTKLLISEEDSDGEIRMRTSERARFPP